MPEQQFLIIPAIDLLEGRAVRLRQGRQGTETVFSDEPVRVAQQWAAAGARRIHLVDLDGAFKGQPANLESVLAIREAVDCELELGGGLRDAAAIRAALDAGVNWAIVGTAAAEQPELFARLAAEFAGRLIVGIDARDGLVVTRGWVLALEDLSAAALAQKMIALGCNQIIYTDVATDGMMAGPNLARLDELARIAGIRVIASGGISRLEDLSGIRGLEQPAICGAIIGRALYEGAIELRRAIAEYQRT